MTQPTRPPKQSLGVKRYVFALAMGVLLAMVGFSCSGSDTKQMPKVLRIAVLPDEDPQSLAKRFTPLFEHLSDGVDLPYEQIPADSYAHLLDLFHNGEIDLARFGGLTFIQADQRDEAFPLVMRDVDLQFTSYFLVRTDSPAERLDDCGGMSFTFGSELSTSGHLMPRYFMQEQGITPETFFSAVSFSGAHDRTAELVRSGEFDVGVANAHIINDMFDTGRLNREDVRVLWVTPPYADYVWAVRPETTPSLRQQLRDAFLELSPLAPEHAPILARLEAGGYQPASVADFVDLRQVAAALGLLEKSP